MSLSVGKILQHAREERDMSLEEVEQATHIRIRYLKALEGNNWSVIPSDVQVRGFIRSYSNFLGLEADQLLNAIDQNLELETPSETIIETSDQHPDRDIPESHVLFSKIGERLRERREILSISQQEVEQHTHIPAHYIEFLESGQIDRFPSPVQARGMLNNYASFMDMDAGEILLVFAEGLQTRLIERHVPQYTPRPSEKRKPRLPAWIRRVFSTDALVFGILSTTIISFIIWGTGRIITTQSDQIPDPTVPSIAEILLPSPTSMPTSSEVVESTETLSSQEEITNPEETPEITIPVANPSGVNVYIVIHQRAWLRVTVDGEIELERRGIPNSAYSFSGKQEIEILTGNGAAIQVFFNDRDLGLLGLFGEVVSATYTTDGPVLPTPTITPIIEEITTTPTPSLTPIVPTEEPPPVP
jgi:cytoskeletal protein RodZ